MMALFPHGACNSRGKGRRSTAARDAHRQPRTSPVQRHAQDRISVRLRFSTPSIAGWHIRLREGHMADGSTLSATTELKVQFVSEDADYNSALGWYNKRTGEAGF